MATTIVAIPVTNLAAGTTMVNLGAISQPYNAVQLKINRIGTGGTNPWLNSLTPNDSLDLELEKSNDGGATWQSVWTAVGDIKGGTAPGKGGMAPTYTDIGYNQSVPFPTGTQFRVRMTASTAMSFDGSATLSG